MSFTSEIKEELTKLNSLKDEKKDFLRRVFLLDGYIANPEKEYHLEILTDERSLADIICEILKEYNINAKVIEKKYKLLNIDSKNTNYNQKTIFDYVE